MILTFLVLAFSNFLKKGNINDLLFSGYWIFFKENSAESLLFFSSSNTKLFRLSDFFFSISLIESWLIITTGAWTTGGIGFLNSSLETKSKVILFNLMPSEGKNQNKIKISA